MPNDTVRRLSRYDELADIASYKSKLTPEQYQWLLDHYVKPELRQDFRDFPGISVEDKRRIARRHKARRRDAFEHPSHDGGPPVVHSIECVHGIPPSSQELALDAEKISRQK